MEARRCPLKQFRGFFGDRTYYMMSHSPSKLFCKTFVAESDRKISSGCLFKLLLSSTIQTATVQVASSVGAKSLPFRPSHIISAKICAVKKW